MSQFRYYSRKDERLTGYEFLVLDHTPQKIFDLHLLPQDSSTIADRLKGTSYITSMFKFTKKSVNSPRYACNTCCLIVLPIAIFPRTASDLLLCKATSHSKIMLSYIGLTIWSAQFRIFRLTLATHRIHSGLSSLTSMQHMVPHN